MNHPIKLAITLLLSPHLLYPALSQASLTEELAAAGFQNAKIESMGSNDLYTQEDLEKQPITHTIDLTAIRFHEIEASDSWTRQGYVQN